MDQISNSSSNKATWSKPHRTWGTTQPPSLSL